MNTRTGGARHRTGGRPVAEPQPATAAPGTVLGSLTIPGRPEHVTHARTFIARTLSRLRGIDSDAATLMTSELVTNAIQHTASGAGGMVTVSVTELPGGALVEVTDDGATGSPVVKSDVYTSEGHGLYLVQQLAAQWGYLRATEGTTVWFHVPATDALDAMSA